MQSVNDVMMLVFECVHTQKLRVRVPNALSPEGHDHESQEEGDD